MQCVANFNIGNDVVARLVKCIVDHPSLVEIDLSCNPLTALSGRAVLRLVRQNTRIQMVNLAGTQVCRSLGGQHTPLLHQCPVRSLGTNPRGPVHGPEPAPAPKAGRV